MADSLGSLMLGVVALLIVVALFVIFAYNRLVALRVRTEDGWSSIDVQLKRRHDLIPNLVEAVKGYAKHEREVLEEVVRARQVGMDASGVQDRAEAENLISASLRRVFLLAEAYPDLKASHNFARLQEELASTENKIAFARQHYNDTVRQYNTALQSFPTNLIAGAFGFEARDFFEIEFAAERQVPEVSL